MMSSPTDYFLENGFAFLPGIGLKYADRLKNDVDALRSHAYTRSGTKKPCASGFYSDDGTLWNAAQSDLITHVQLSYRTSSTLLRFAMDEEILSILAGIYETPVETFGQGQCLVKAPKSSFSKHWHQDDAFFPHAKSFQTATLLYLQDTDEVNGALKVVPRSHLSGILPHENSGSHLGLSVDDAWTELPGKKGDVILLHGLTLHASGENRTDSWRDLALNRYRAAGDYVLRTGTSVETDDVVDVPFAPEGSAIGQEGLLVSGTRPLQDAPGWAWPIWQQNQFPV